MISEIESIVTSQTPWMALCIALVVYIVKLQNDKLGKMCDALANITLLYSEHDKRAIDIHEETTYIRDWCIQRTGSSVCSPPHSDNSNVAGK